MGPGQPFNPYKLFVGSFLPNTILRYPHLSPSAKLVWARLAQFAGRDGKAHPKIDTIADEVALSERQVKRLLNELVQQGFLRKIKATGHQRLLHFPDEYLFLWHPCFDQPCPAGGDVDVPSGGGVDVPSNTRESFQENKEPPISPKGDDGFDQFWKSYPKKKSKGDAEKAWKTLKPTKDLLSSILTAIERAKVSPDWTKDGGQFIPFPATWLRRKGWEDEEFTPLASTDPYADNPMGMYADWPTIPCEELCIHGWGLTPELRAKHGDDPDHECGACRTEAARKTGTL